jgi:hypothetical protein
MTLPACLLGYCYVVLLKLFKRVSGEEKISSDSQSACQDSNMGSHVYESATFIEATSN